MLEVDLPNARHSLQQLEYALVKLLTCLLCSHSEFLAYQGDHGSLFKNPKVHMRHIPATAMISRQTYNKDRMAYLSQHSPDLNCNMAFDNRIAASDPVALHS